MANPLAARPYHAATGFVTVFLVAPPVVPLERLDAPGFIHQDTCNVLVIHSSTDGSGISLLTSHPDPKINGLFYTYKLRVYFFCVANFKWADFGALMSTTTHQILLSSNDSNLLSSRAMVLEKAGFRVTCIDRGAPLATIPSDVSVELVILGHSLSEEEQDELVKKSRERWAGARILRLAIGNDTLQQESRDEFVFSSIDPEKLIKVCRELLAGKSGAQINRVSR